MASGARRTRRWTGLDAGPVRESGVGRAKIAAMGEWALVVLLTAAAGMAIPLGATVASVERVRPRWLEQELRHGVLAFGGGALLAAVSLVLVPHGVEALPIWASVAAMLGGGLAFLWLDLAVARLGGSASNLIAAMADFIPEAVALGAVCARGAGPTALVLALLIGLQNLPEGFNAYREITARGTAGRRRVIGSFWLLSLLGPIAGSVGLLWLADYHATVAVLMLAASGGILYLMFEDIAPQARLERRWAPPLGAVLGFASGLAGHLLIQRLVS